MLKMKAFEKEITIKKTVYLYCIKMVMEVVVVLIKVYE